MVGEVVASGFWCPKCTFLEDSYDVTPDGTGVNLEETRCQSCGCKSGIHVTVNVVRTD